MRLLWARVGVPYSPATGLPIESQTVSQMVDRIMALPEGTRLYLLAPVVRGRKGEYRKELADYQKKGFQRVKIDGKFHEIADGRRSTRNSPTTSTSWSIASSFAPTSPRASPICRTALKLAEGLAVAEFADAPGPAPFETRAGRAPQDEDKSRGGRSPPPEEARRAVSKDDAPRARQSQPAAQRNRGAPRLLGEIRLPGVRLHHSGNRAAAVLVQQSVRRLPEMRRARRRAAHRRRSGHSRQGAHLAQGRHRAVGQIVVAVLRADAHCARQALQVHPRHQVEGPWEEDPGRHPLRLRRHRNPLLLRRRHARLRDQAAVRRRHHQSGTPLPRDRQRLGARGNRPLFHRRAMRGLQGLSSQARSVVREDRRHAHRRNLRHVGQRRSPVVH